MRPNKKSVSLKALGILIFITIGFLFLAFSFWTKRRTEKYKPEHNNFILSEVKLLSSESINSKRKSLAIHRISSSHYSEFQKEIQSLLESKDKEIKSSAGEAYIKKDPKPSIKKIRALITDSDFHVRIKSFESLSLRNLPEIRGLLEKQLGRHQIHEKEKIAIYSALIAQETEVSKREKLLSLLIEMASSKSEDTRSYALQSFERVQKDHPILSDKMRNILYHAQDETLIPLAIEHLSRTQDSWLRDNFATFLFHSSRSVRLSSITYFQKLCPKNAKELLEDLLKKEELPFIRAKAQELLSKNNFFKCKVDQNN